MKCIIILFLIAAFFYSNSNIITTSPKLIKLPLSDTYTINFSLYNSYTYSLIVDLQGNKLGVNKTINDHLSKDHETFLYSIFYDNNCYLTSFSNTKNHFGLYFKDSGNELGLGRYSNEDKKYSLIHSLYETGLIHKEIFSLELTSDKQNQFLYLGGYPDDINKYSAINSFDVNKNLSYTYETSWCFYTDTIKVNGNYMENVNKSIVLSLTGDTTLVTNDIFKWLELNVFKEYIENNRCKIENIFSWFHVICDMDVYNELPKILFIQGNNIFEYTIRTDIRGRVDIAYNPYLDYENDVIFIRTNAFIDKILSFNYETNTITVYSNSKRKTFIKYKNTYLYNQLMNLFIITTIIGILNSLMYLSNKHK